MMFERRAYRLRPGKLQAFWDAQTAWNTDAVFGPILERNIGYFSATSERGDEVVHLYRFETLEEWHALYTQFYAAQSPDYFALVRPWMLRQDTTFFAPPPIAAFAACLTGPCLRLPPGVDPNPEWESFCIVETTTTLLPGGLPHYWQASHAHRGAPEPHLLAEAVSLVGRLHRLLRYEAFATTSDAHRHREARALDPRWQTFVLAFGDWVADQTTTMLRPSPLPSRRALLRGSGERA